MILAQLGLSGAVASSPATATESLFYVDQSEGCFADKKYPCAVKAIRGIFRIDRGGQIFVLDQGSSILMKSESEIQLLEGEMWIEKSADLGVNMNPYLKAQVSGEFWLRKDGDKIFISNLEGEFKFISNKIFSNETLPMGFENWYAGIRTDQKINSGIIQPISFEKFASDWARIYSGPKAEKLTRLKSYRDKWKDSVAQSAEMYAKVIERTMASVENKKRQERKTELDREKEREALKQLFRSKNYLDPDSL